MEETNLQLILIIILLFLLLSIIHEITIGFARTNHSNHCSCQGLEYHNNLAIC